MLMLESTSIPDGGAYDLKVAFPLVTYSDWF